MLGVWSGAWTEHPPFVECTGHYVLDIEWGDEAASGIRVTHVKHLYGDTGCKVWSPDAAPAPGCAKRWAVVGGDLRMASGGSQADAAHRVFGVQDAALTSPYSGMARHLVGHYARDRDIESVCYLFTPNLRR